MTTLTKDKNTKIIDEKSSLLPVLLAMGWVAEVAKKATVQTKKKEIDDAISSSISN